MVTHHGPIAPEAKFVNLHSNQCVHANPEDQTTGCFAERANDPAEGGSNSSSAPRSKTHLEGGNNTHQAKRRGAGWRPSY